MIEGGNQGLGIAKRIPVNQYNMNGELIATYVSISEASRITGISSGDIGLCCRGIRNSINGFQ